MERNELGANVRLLANEQDVGFVTRLADGTIVAFLSAAIGITSAILVNAGANTRSVAVAHALGHAGLAVATILGLRILVSITRDRAV
jgi:hypothetical protein